MCIWKYSLALIISHNLTFPDDPDEPDGVRLVEQNFSHVAQYLDFYI